jgi:hypothetical protein
MVEHRDMAPCRKPELYRQCPVTQVYPPEVGSQCAGTQTEVVAGVITHVPEVHT